jgi:hypothetical protein
MPYTGNSRSYVLRRLRRTEGLEFLADAIEGGVITASAVSIELGWRGRPDFTGARTSQSKARHFLFQKLVREHARATRDR